jgi:polysaccharide biosynthesis transport protein
MEIRQYLAIIQRWLWLLIVGTVIGAGLAYLISFQQEKTYQASTRVQVMSAPLSTNNPYAYFNDQQLAKTYVQTLKTRPILDAVEKELGIKISTGQITTRTYTETQLIGISVEYPDPQLAADIANTLVNVFSEKNNELQAGRFLESEQSLNNQLAQVDAQIQNFQSQFNEMSSAEVEKAIQKANSEISRLESDILSLQSEVYSINNRPLGIGWVTPTVTPKENARLNEKEMQLKLLQNTYNLYQQVYINLVVMGNSSSSGSSTTPNDKLQSTLALYQQIRASLLGSYEEVRLARLNSTSNIVSIEPAIANNTPIRPQTARDVGLGGAIGMLVAGMIVFLINYLDNTLKTAEQITNVLGLPVIGYIANIEHDKDEPFVAQNPRSPISESFRSLRTNLEFASVDRSIKTMLVVSAHPAEGKSTIASNLAVIYAQGGNKVMLIDADLRKPSIHRYFGLSNRVGLSDVFRNSVSLEDVAVKWKDLDLQIVTSGGLPPNPADLLSSRKMASTLQAARQAVDIVIVDSPPFLVADASILAANLDGVLLVVSPGKTPIDAAITTLEQMKRAGAQTLGVVMNRIPRNRSYYYGGYRYYSHYYQDRNSYGYYGGRPKGKRSTLVSRLGRLFKKGRGSPEPPRVPTNTNDPQGS